MKFNSIDMKFDELKSTLAKEIHKANNEEKFNKFVNLNECVNNIYSAEELYRKAMKMKD